MPTTKKTPRKHTTTEDAAPFGTVPRPKYESGPTGETVNDSHSRSSDAESPTLGEDHMPGAANRTKEDDDRS